MSAAPFDVRELADRLKAAATGLRSVQFAAEFAAVRELKDFPAPCAYVLLAAEVGIPKPMGSAPPGQQVQVAQLVAVTFGVAYALRSGRVSNPQDVLDEWSQLLGKARGSLFGYVPNVKGARPIEFVRGDLQQYDQDTALWVDVFSTQHAIASPSGST